MSGLQSGAQDASVRLFSALPSFGCHDTIFHRSSSGDRSVAPRLVASKAGALESRSDGEDFGRSGPVVAPAPSYSSLRPTDRKGGDSGEPFIQSEVPGG